MPRSYAILGVGALGGYYGACLARAGADVHFLLRSDHGHVAAHGLNVTSAHHGDLSIARPAAHRDPRDVPRCDVVIVSLKTTQNHVLTQVLPHLVKDDDTVVLVLQNGLHPERDAAAVVGHDRVLGGLCFLCSNKTGPGTIRHLDYGRIALARHTPDGAPGGVTDAMRAVAEDFADTPVPITLFDDLVLARWKKLVWNVPYNGLSVVHRTTTDHLMADPGLRREVETLMEEVVAMAEAAAGRTIEPAFIRQMLDDTLNMEPYRTSMMLDHDAGREMEVEAIYGDPLRAAAKAEHTPPRLAQLYDQLTAINRRLTS